VVCAPAAGQVYVTTEGSGFDTVLNVFRDNNTFVTCNGETPVPCLLLIPEVCVAAWTHVGVQPAGRHLLC